LPNLPGQKMTGVLVEYAPGASLPPHHHTAKGSVVAYVLEGAIHSKVNNGPERVYPAGESWLEPPGGREPDLLKRVRAPSDVEVEAEAARDPKWQDGDRDRSRNRRLCTRSESGARACPRGGRDRLFRFRNRPGHA
jgi:hypothetical protein